MSTATAYGPFGKHLLKGDIDLDTQTLKLSLHTSSYTPDKDHEYFSSVTNEITGPGYTAGGKSLTSLVTAYDTVNDRSTFSAANVTWTALTATFRYGVLRQDTGSSATSPVILWIDFITNQVYSGTDANILWDSSGIYRINA